MSYKYTKYCNSQTLLKHINSQFKDQQAMHILLSVFKKSLNWIQQKYDRQMLIDSISKISVCQNHLQSKIVWIFVIQGNLWYHEMPFIMSEFIKFTNFQPNHIRYSANSTYAILTEQDIQWLQQQNKKRQKQKISKFIKSNLFYPYYIQEQHIRQFVSLIRIKHLPYNKVFNWKDEDGSFKFALIYKGVVSIQYHQWKRLVQIAQITKGMFLTNHYIKDELQEMEDYSLEPLEDNPNKKNSFPKFKFISKSEDTVLLVFNQRLISENPYNVNPQIKPNIKKQFQKHTSKLQQIIGSQTYNRLHRNKKSIKQQLKRKKQKDTIQKEITSQIKDRNMKLSPILQYYSNLSLSENSLDTINTQLTDIPEPSKPFSHTIFSTISHSPNRSRLLRSKTTIINNSNKSTIHNTWIEQANKKKKNTKSFSTLKALTTRRQKIEHNFIKQQLEQQKEPSFFVPNQFVKRKLKLKYENLLSKVKNLDLTITNKNQQSLIQKMKRLEQYIDSKRIVKLNTIKTKHKLLRDKVQY